MIRIFLILTSLITASAVVVFAQQESCQISPSALTTLITVKNDTTMHPDGKVKFDSIFVQAARDWHDFHKFHEHVEEAIHEVEIARRANHYDMAGHGHKADVFLRLAEKELRLADDSTNSGQ